MTTDLEARLRRDLRAGTPGDLDTGELVGRARRRAAAARARRVRVAAAGTAVALVLAVVVGLALRPTGDDTVQTTPGPAPTATPTAETTGPTSTSTSVTPTSRPTPSTMLAPLGLADVAWQPLAANPLGSRNDPVAVWSGTEAITWGGTDAAGIARADGAAYDPATNTWRAIDAGELSPRIDAQAFWTGSEMLVLGGATPDGGLLLPQLAAYDPTTDAWSWRATPPFLTVTTADPAVWTGDALVVVARDGRTARYDPADDAWTSIPTAPIAPRADAAAVWTGTELIVWGGVTDDGKNLADGAALDPTTGVWRTLAPAPLSGRVTTAVWTGRAVVVRGGYQGTTSIMALGDGAAYDPVTDAWSPISSGPAHPGFTAVWTGTAMVEMAKGGAVLWDERTDRWTAPDELTGGPYGSRTSMLWTGTYVLAFGPRGDGGPGGGVALQPDRVTLR